MTRLINSELEDYLENTSDMKSQLNEALYNHYTQCNTLSKTGSIKGDAGDSIKKYVSSAHIGTISRAINVISNFETAVQKLKDLGHECDSDSNAKIDSDTLDDTKKDVDDKKKEFIDITSDSSSLLSDASEFIDTVPLGKDKVESGYDDSEKNINDTNTKLENMDKEGQSSLSSITSEIQGLVTQINKLSSEYHDKHGIIASKINSITKEPWYKSEVNSGEFKKMKAESPVEYAEGEKVNYRKQLYSKDGKTVGTFQRGSIHGKSYVTKDSLGAEGDMSVLNSNVKTKDKYSESQAGVEIISAKGNVDVDSKHIKANANAQLFDAGLETRLGSEDYNFHGKTNVEVASASAGLTAGIDGVGLEAEAVGAKAEVDGGFTIGGINFDVGGSVGAQAGGKVEASARGIEVDAKFLFGAKIKITW